MEYRSISAKLPINELTMFKSFCEKKGVSPASLIRDLILREMKITIPHTVAGKNKIIYDRKNDSFTWSIELDNEEQIEVIKNVSPVYIENLEEMIKHALDERQAFIHKMEKDSVPVPNGFLRRRK